MDDRINELKEKQQEIGDKISLLQETNKRKDEEAAEIRQLIAECRENLNRIKGLSPGSEVPSPCENLAEDTLQELLASTSNKDETNKLSDESDGSRGSRDGSKTSRDGFKSSRDGTKDPRDSTKDPRDGTKDPRDGTKDSRDGSRDPRVSNKDSRDGSRDPRVSNKDSRYGNKDPRDSSKDPRDGSKDPRDSSKDPRDGTKDSRYGTKDPRYGTKDPYSERGVEPLSQGDSPNGKRKHEDLRQRIPCENISRKKKKKGQKEPVSCKVDLNKMKVRVRGPSEDLKRLDATQLISLLEKFQCQELIINTGEEVLTDPGEIRLIYLLHPGNLVMVAGILLVAFLINTNLCHTDHLKNKRLLLDVLYVTSFAFHCGMVLWMIFIRGCALRLGLNQDVFHLVDNIVLPKYYFLCVLLSALSLYSFLATHSLAPCTSWPLAIVSQIIIAVTMFFTQLATICYVIPALIKLRNVTDDYIFDDEDPDCTVPQSYEKNLVKLQKLNWTLCLINFLTLLLLGASIYFLTLKLQSGNAK